MKFHFLSTCLISLITLTSVFADEANTDISFYTGTFDVIDKEGDDQFIYIRE